MQKIELARRSVLGAIGALAACGRSAAAAVFPANGHLVPIRGTRLYIDDSGPRTAPALLYLHGGPGAGSLDFQLYQRSRLNQALRLVIIDQRGVLRSDPVSHMGMNDLVEDCEAVRTALGIERWCVLGHSFGGLLALRYAVAYPRPLHGVLFENPTFSIGSSMRSLLGGAATIFDEEHKSGQAAAIRSFIAQNPSAHSLWDAFGKAGGELGPARNRLYVHQPALRDFFERMKANSGLSEAQWSRASDQVNALVQEGLLFDDLTPWLPRLEPKALLLHGKYDDVTARDQRLAFTQSAKGRQVQVFDNSSHFIHVEEPEAFARTVQDFVFSVQAT